MLSTNSTVIYNFLEKSINSFKIRSEINDDSTVWICVSLGAESQNQICVTKPEKNCLFTRNLKVPMT